MFLELLAPEGPGLLAPEDVAGSGGGGAIPTPEAVEPAPSWRRLNLLERLETFPFGLAPAGGCGGVGF